MNLHDEVISRRVLSCENTEKEHEGGFKALLFRKSTRFKQLTNAAFSLWQPNCKFSHIYILSTYTEFSVI